VSLPKPQLNPRVLDEAMLLRLVGGVIAVDKAVKRREEALKREVSPYRAPQERAR
jgi:hypothetical protein